MQWLEIINVRVGASDCLVNQQKLQNLVSTVRMKWRGSQATLYQHSTLSTDFIIFLCHQSVHPEKRGSELGIHLAWLLEEYGFINHTVWLED